MMDLRFGKEGREIGEEVGKGRDPPDRSNPLL
jgi:hypothetical protein